MEALFAFAELVLGTILENRNVIKLFLINKLLCLFIPRGKDEEGAEFRNVLTFLCS